MESRHKPTTEAQTMDYVIEISRQDVQYTENGDRVELRDRGTDTEEYDSEFDGPDPLPWYSVRRYLGAAERERKARAAWAVERIQRTDAYEPSVYPVPAELHASAWLGGTYEHPYLDETEETSVRLSGAWTPAERAEVFRAVCSAVPGYGS
jgi:hypothetical protein